MGKGLLLESIMELFRNLQNAEIINYRGDQDKTEITKSNVAALILFDEGQK